jgi:ribosomal protein S18 acetylase RimI-like enzyme
MSMVNYREADPDDIPTLARIRTEGGEREAFERDRMARYLAREHHPRQALMPRVIYVALEGDVPVGFIAGHLTRRYACEGELQWISVIPEHRGSGVASDLLRLLAAWFAEQNASRICVDVDPANLRARRFYTRHGAEPLNEHWLVWHDIGDVLAERPPSNES